jgi:rubrerythrin
MKKKVKKAAKKVRKKAAQKRNDPQNVDELLLTALGSEAMAMDFYLKAAQKARSSAGVQLFSELAGFEKNHYEHVKSIIEARNKGEVRLPAASAVTFKNVRPEVEGEFEPNRDEIVDVLNLGIRAEKDAQARYRRIAAMLKDRASQEMFETLAEDERRHLNLLENEFYMLSNKGTIIWE